MENKQVHPLTSIRFILAIFIFLLHLPEPYRFDEGYFVVTTFFILSGFGLYVGYSNRKIQPVDFLSKRLVRIYPVHILTLLFAVVLVLFTDYLGQYSAKDFALNLFLHLALIQSFTLRHNTFNSLAWFLSNILFLYLVFPFLLSFMKKSVKGFLGFSVVFHLMIVSALYLLLDNHHYTFYVCPLGRILDFSLGMILGYLYLTGKYVVKNRIGLFLMEILALALLLIPPMYKYEMIPKALRYDLYYLSFSLMFIFIFTVSARSGGSFCYRILNNKYLLLLGNVSFDFYMVHQLVIISSTHLNREFTLLNAPWLVAVQFLFSLGASLVLYYFIEPAIRKKIGSLSFRKPSGLSFLGFNDSPEEGRSHQ